MTVKAKRHRQKISPAGRGCTIGAIAGIRETVVTATSLAGLLYASANPAMAQTMPAGWPSTATIPYNLGGTTSGTYTDSAGKTYDGTGYIVVDIDGAFRTDNPVFKYKTLQLVAGYNKVKTEACVGQKTDTQWTGLCPYEDASTWVSRPLPGKPSAGYYLITLQNSSMPSDAADNQCRETSNPDNPQYCHYYHGTATSGIMVGEPTDRWEGTTHLVYTGVAPGAQVIPIRIGGGTGTDGPRGWPINSVVDALTYVNNGLMNRTDVNSKIVAVNISASGDPVAGDALCATDADGARIDALAASLRAKGVAVVMSAGNDGMYATGNWTCGNNVIVVGATGIVNPTVPTSYTNISQKVALFAPVGTADRDSGDFVLAPWAGLGSFYIWGTSFSAPQVAAAFAVLRQKFGSGPSVSSLVQLMKSTGTPITGQRAGFAPAGASVLNIKAALNGTPPSIK